MMSLWGSRSEVRGRDGGGQGGLQRQVKDTEGRFIPPRREELGGEWRSKVRSYPGLLCNHLLTASEEGIMGAANLTQVLCENDMRPVSLTHFSHPAGKFPPVF